MSARPHFVVEGAAHPLRQCALMLHSVGRADREWLLSQLNGSQAKVLVQLLGELDALGIPVDSSAAQMLLAPAHTPAAARQATPHAPAGKDDTNPHPREPNAVELAQLLRHEPARLIAQVLMASDPLERRAVLSYLNAAKRRQVRECMVAAKAGALAQGIAPRSLQVVQEQLSIRFAAQRGTAAPARLRAGLTRWKVRLSLLREALS